MIPNWRLGLAITSVFFEFSFVRLVIWTAVLPAMLIGCDASSFFTAHEYAASTSPEQYRSLNGLGVLRKAFEIEGAKVLTPKKLTSRLYDFDVLILAGDTYGPPGLEAREWLEDWLSYGDKTIIYFGRDFNAELFYRVKTLPLVAPEQQRAAEQFIAELKATELAKRAGELMESTFCGWFYLSIAEGSTTHTSFRGPWSSQLPQGEWMTSIKLEPPAEEQQQRSPSWLAKGKPKWTGSKFKSANLVNDTEIIRSVWHNAELSDQEKWDEAFLSIPDSTVVLSAADGTPLVTVLESESWSYESKIIVVANGAPFFNGSIVQPLHQAVASKIVDECNYFQRVGILNYDDGGLLISNVPEADPRGVGFEALTVWPLSAVTMPAALIGILVCMILWPTLGRPTSPVSRSVSDFGLHIEAMGEMLRDSRDDAYAHRTISEYFKRVKKETPPSWLTPESLPSNPYPQFPAPLQPAASTTDPPRVAPNDSPPAPPSTLP